MTKKLINYVVDKKWWFIVVSLLFAAVSSHGLTKLEIHSSYRDFFDETNSQLQAFDTIKSTYTDSDTVLIVVSPSSGTVFESSAIKAIRRITEEAWHTPFSIRVDSLTNYQHTKIRGDELFVGNLVPEGNLGVVELRYIKDVALSEPMLLDRLVSESGTVAGIAVTLSLPQLSKDEVKQVVKSIRALRDSVEEDYPNLRVHLTGTVMLNAALSEVASSDYVTLVPLMILVITVLLLGLLRSVAGVAVCLAVILLSVTTGLGLFGWMGGILTPAALSAPIIIMTVAVADCIHILACFFKECRCGYSRDEAMMLSLQSNLRPVLITTLTTVVGFLAMNTSEVPPFRDLGNIVALGVLAALGFSIVLMPLIMIVVPVRGLAVNTWVNRINVSEFIIRRRRLCFSIGMISALLLVVMVPKNQLNDQFVGFFSGDVEFRKDTDFVSDNLTGIYTFEYSFHSGNQGGVNEPSFLSELEYFSNWVSTQPEVVHVNIISDTFKRLNQNMHGDDESWYKLPDTRQLAAQYMLLYEMSLPFGLSTDNQISADKSSTKVTVTLKNISSNESLLLEKRIDDWLAKNTKILLDYEVSSANLMFSHAGYLNAQSMISGTLIAVLFITVVMVLTLRSFYFGVLSALMNLLPIGAAFGAWAMIDGNIGMPLTTAVAMSLGIVVDDTVHLLCKYLDARRIQGLSQEAAVRIAFDRVGPALVTTSLVLIAGFSVLSFSSFGINSDRGLFVSMTILFALLLLYSITPWLLISDYKQTKNIQNNEVIPA